MPQTKEEKLLSDFFHMLTHAEAEFLLGALQVMVEKNINIWDLDIYHSSSVLTQACLTNDYDKIELIANACPIDKIETLVQGTETNIPLITLLQRFDEEKIIESVNLLLSKGADPNCQINNVGTALGVAVQKGYVKCVAALLSYGANINTIDSQGRTPIFRAAADLNYEMVKLLLARGARLDLDHGNILSAVCTAYRYQREKAGHGDRRKIIRALFEAAPLIMNNYLVQQDVNGLNPLHSLCIFGKARAIDELCYNAELGKLKKALQQKGRIYESMVTPKKAAKNSHRYSDKKLDRAVQFCREKTEVLDTIKLINSTDASEEKVEQYKQVLKNISKLDASGNNYITRIATSVIGSIAATYINLENVEMALQSIIPLQEYLPELSVTIANKLLENDAVICPQFASKDQERLFALLLIKNIDEEHLSPGLLTLRKENPSEDLDKNNDYIAAYDLLAELTEGAILDNLEYQKSMGSMRARVDLFMIYSHKGEHDKAQSVIPERWNSLQLIAAYGTIENLTEFCEFTPPRELLTFSLNKQRKAGPLSSNITAAEIAKGNRLMLRRENFYKFNMFYGIINNKLCFFNIHHYFCEYGLQALPGFKARLSKFAELLQIVTNEDGYTATDINDFVKTVDPYHSAVMNDDTFFKYCRYISRMKPEEVTANAQKYLDFIKQIDNASNDTEAKVINKLKLNLEKLDKSDHQLGSSSSTL